MVALPPMTSAMRMAAVAQSPGDFVRIRAPCRTSFRSWSIARDVESLDERSSRNGLSQSYPVECIPRGHVGQDDLVPDLQPGLHLNGIDRALAQRDLHARRVAVDAGQPEQAYGALFLTERRAPHIKDVFQSFQLNRPVDAEIGHRPARERFGQRDVHGHRSVGSRRIFPADFAGDDPVPRIDLRALADLDVLGLRLSDLQLGFQLPRIGDACEIDAWPDALTDFDRDLLQHASETGGHL